MQPQETTIQRRKEYRKQYYESHKEELLVYQKEYRMAMTPERYERWREQIRQSYYRRKAEKQK